MYSIRKDTYPGTGFMMSYTSTITADELAYMMRQWATKNSCTLEETWKKFNDARKRREYGNVFMDLAGYMDCQEQHRVMWRDFFYDSFKMNKKQVKAIFFGEED